MTIKVKKDKHYSSPLRFKMCWKPRRLKSTVIFNEDCNYDLKDSDQLDWNKLTGWTYTLNPLNESVMIGWRYNKETDKIELNAYYHIDGERFFTDPLLEVNRGEAVKTTIEINYRDKMYYVLLHANGKTVSNHRKFKHRKKIARRINFYFGGNEVAPQTVSIQSN